MSMLCRRVLIPGAAKGGWCRSLCSKIRPGKSIEELAPGLDWNHWLIVTEPLDKGATRNQIIDNYVKTLATAVGSEEEARKRIYSVCTQHYSQFGAIITEDLTPKLKALPNVRFVLPDSYENPKTKSYGGEPFINGEAAPYDPKYYEYYLKHLQNIRHNHVRRYYPDPSTSTS